MANIINKELFKKAENLKKPLHERILPPLYTVEFKKDSSYWHNIKRENEKTAVLPVELNAGDSVIFDFGEHLVGYISYSVENDGLKKITDAPVKLKFSFGEFPLEITTPPEEYKGGLGCGWLQNEERSFVFTPYSGSLERRYAFRYLKIQRTDNAVFPVKLSDIKVRAVSAVKAEDAKKLESEDRLLQKIYSMSVNTLKECEQDVFEDGPKRDRRLWIGDLKLQAMTDYQVFGNLDLIKRCIYLFASVTPAHKMVAPCIFPDSPPYVDEWTFCDYSLFFISCLYDWYINTGDKELPKELFDIAYTQMEKVSEKINRDTGEIALNPFIDWCRGLDKSIAVTGVYICTLKQLKELCSIVNASTEKADYEIKEAEKRLLKYFDKEKNLFVTKSGQISWHSQVWGILSGVLSREEEIKVLESIKASETEFTMRTPYMMHYYIEALIKAGLKQEALEFIRSTWGAMADAGFDCCPEVFNIKNEFESPYHAPEINSACHAWSCTPAYWIPKLIK